jgi:hypothetical protein
VSIVMLMDFFLVALRVERSLAMFARPLGTWIPFGLIFVSAFAVGRVSVSGARSLKLIASGAVSSAPTG